MLLTASVLEPHQLKYDIKNVFSLISAMSACGHDVTPHSICDSAGDVQLLPPYQRRTSHFKWENGVVWALLVVAQAQRDKRHARLKATEQEDERKSLS